MAVADGRDRDIRRRARQIERAAGRTPRKKTPEACRQAPRRTLQTTGHAARLRRECCRRLNLQPVMVNPNREYR